MRIKLWQIRNGKQITLKELEELTGIPKSTLNDIENGKVSPNLRTLEQIAKTTGYRINDLFESEFQ